MSGNIERGAGYEAARAIARAQRTADEALTLTQRNAQDIANYTNAVHGGKGMTSVLIAALLTEYKVIDLTIYARRGQPILVIADYMYQVGVDTTGNIFTNLQFRLYRDSELIRTQNRGVYSKHSGGFTTIPNTSALIHAIDIPPYGGAIKYRFAVEASTALPNVAGAGSITDYRMSVMEL